MKEIIQADTAEQPKQEVWSRCYIGTKIVRANPMNYEAWARSQNRWQENQETQGDGYRVQYEDGYISWSPKNVFERCYREITRRETEMVIDALR